MASNDQLFGGKGTQASLLVGYSDVDGNTLSAANLSASNGSLSAFNAATGSWTFTPAANYNGTVNLSYGVSDGTVTIPATQSFTLAAVNDAPTGIVTISGNAPAQRNLLIANNNLADADGLGTVSYEWLANGTVITGATGAYLTLGQSQVGKAISVKATYTDSFGKLEGVVSAATAAVANVNDAPTGTLSLLRSGASITGDTAVKQGDVLQAGSTLADLDGLGKLSYQWQSSADGVNWSAIGGANAASLTLAPTLAGRMVRVAASYTDGWSSKESVTSASTLIVNRAVGTAGADQLAGTTGADRLEGLAGDDRYRVNNADDMVVENADGGTDTVISTVDYTLTANVENLTLTGGAALKGTGNALNNTLIGNAAANVLGGGDGNDTLKGADGDDVLDGQAGNDVLAGGAGNDTFLMNRGYGADIVQDNDPSVGNTDTLRFGAGIANNQLWFRKAGNNLEVSVVGTADKATVRNWYLSNQHHIEQIKAGDGKVLLDTQVEALVQAMAAFKRPAMGQTSLTASQQTALAPVLAASWH